MATLILQSTVMTWAAPDPGAWKWQETDAGLRLQFGADDFITRELVQLIDRSTGWKTVAAYETQDISPQPGPLPNGHTGTQRTLHGKLRFQRQVWIENQDLHIRIECTLLEPNPATDHYYSLQIPAAFLQKGAWRASVGDIMIGSRFTDAPGGHTLAQPFRRLELVTSSDGITIQAQSAGADWSFQDWRTDLHDAYRLRIELPAEKGAKWSGKLVFSIQPSPPDVAQFAARTRQQSLNNLLPASNQQLQINDLTCLTARPTVGQACELVADLDCTYDDPFDPNDITVSATVQTPRRTYELPAFYYVPFTRRQTANTHKVVPGAHQWRVRFLPTRHGEHTVTLTARDRTGRTQSDPLTLTAKPAQWHGLLRVSKTNPLALEFENADPFSPLGVNIFDWTDLGAPLPPDRIDKSIHHIQKLAQAGGNFIRLRMDSWWFAIDNPLDPVSGYMGAGRFNQRACWDIDRILAQCQRLGIQVMLCIENANGNVNSPREGWRKRYNVYAKDNGGPCEDIDEFWTNERASDLVRRKIRYCVARWSASPALAIWEFFNEVHIGGRVDPDTVAAWHEEMAREFKRLDPHRRIVTTSPSGGSEQAARDKLWQAPHLDVAQLHDYRWTNTANVYTTAQHGATAYGKPFIVGEFGMSGRVVRSKQFNHNQDPDGIIAHLGHWSSAMSLAAGTALDWYVGGYLDPLNLWDDFTALHRFIADLPRTDPQLKPIDIENVTQAPPKKLDHPIDVVISPDPRWEKAEHNRFHVTKNGSLQPPGQLNGWLWGLQNHPDLRNPPTFVLNYPLDGNFVVHVTEVVGRHSNPVEITLDGQMALREDLVCEIGKGDKSQVRQPGPDGNVAVWYNRDLTVDVPAGQHQVTVQNLGLDRLAATYRLEDYATFPKTPHINVHGLQHSAGAHLWVHNNTWNPDIILGTGKHTTAHDVTVSIAGLRNGPVRIQRCNPAEGTIEATRKDTVIQNSLPISLPVLETDAAFKVRYTQ